MCAGRHKGKVEQERESLKARREKRGMIMIQEHTLYQCSLRLSEKYLKLSHFKALKYYNVLISVIICSLVLLKYVLTGIFALHVHS